MRMLGSNVALENDFYRCGPAVALQDAGFSRGGPVCTLCDTDSTCNLVHALISCSHNNGVGQWLLQLVGAHVPDVSPQQLTLLDLCIDDDRIRLPIIWLIANTLGNI